MNLGVKTCISSSVKVTKCVCICSKHHSFVQIVISLYRAWAREAIVSAGIYGEAVCPFTSLSATSASEICC